MQLPGVSWSMDKDLSVRAIAFSFHSGRGQRSKFQVESAAWIVNGDPLHTSPSSAYALRACAQLSLN